MTEARREALFRLGIDRLVLSIQQVSFPASDDDIGHGAPASKRGLDFLRFASNLGFSALALGPAGITTHVNRSPYDATLFSKSPLAISFERLTSPEWGGLLDRATLDEELSTRFERGDRARYDLAERRANNLLTAFHRAARKSPSRAPDLEERLKKFRARSPWLDAEARFEAVASAVGHDDPTRFPQDPPFDTEAKERFELAQLAISEQVALFSREAAALGVSLMADAQIGIGHRDRALYRHLLLPRYRMGAPPSRTNPEGQPWEYPVLDPRLWTVTDESGRRAKGPAQKFVEARFRSLFQEYGGVRIDHPHGWVCPWVYASEGRLSPEQARVSVQRGARLFESPDLPDHPELAAFARVRPEQIDRSRERYADEWVKWIEPAQVDSYSSVFDLIVALAKEHGKGPSDLMVELLSTCPRPLFAVLEKHGLGRFRVTQKARVEVREDVYRGDNAQPVDWMMTGNHDTPPLALVAQRFVASGEAAPRARYLAERLCRPEADQAERGAFAAKLAADPLSLSEAMVAELFVGPARNVLIFWTDLFGIQLIFNRPGVVSEENWTLRVPSDFERAHTAAVAERRAPSLGRALAQALTARGHGASDEGRALIARLEEESRP